MSEKRHIVQWLGGMLMLLLMVGCSSSSDDEPLQHQGEAVLKFDLIAPNAPSVTRSEKGNVDASFEENVINTLDVWAFDNHAGEFISYLHLNNFSFENDGKRTVSMKLSDTFNNYSGLQVDFYVAANVTASNCGLTLNQHTTAQELRDACIGTVHFGTSSPVTSVPYDGLPMSGVLKGMTVTGSAPIFSVAGSVKLVRAVSKMRFIFSQSISNPPEISNLSISLNTGVLPDEESLFLSDAYPTAKSNPGNSYNTAEVSLLSGVSGTEIKSYSDPASYGYQPQETGQEYETKINNGLAAGHLSELGRFYLRESDKKVEGTISYTIGTGEQAQQKTANFSADAGDFTRNHTWIIYGYFLGSGNLMLNVVSIKDWKLESEIDKFYNW